MVEDIMTSQSRSHVARTQRSGSNLFVKLVALHPS